MKVLCIGHSSWDITVPVDEYPIEDYKYRFNEKYSAGGGPAANAAYLLGKWGIDTSIACVVGSDDFGTNIKKEFQDIRVDTTYIETSYDKDTSLSFILINKQTGSRTVFNVAKEHPALKKLNFDCNPDIIFVDGHDYGASQSALSKYSKAISIIDAGRATPEILELCKYIKYIVCSREFAEVVTGLKFDYDNPQTLVNVYLKLQNKYPNANIVITLENHGALYISNGQIKIMPGLKVQAVDTTGAGDIFHGAFTYGVANNFDMDKIITLANIAAGLSVTKMGSRLSIPNLSEVLDYYTNKMGIQNNANASANNTNNVTNSAQPTPNTQEAQVSTTQTMVAPNGQTSGVEQSQVVYNQMPTANQTPQVNVPPQNGVQ